MASKRPFDRNAKEQNGRRKMQKMGPPEKGTPAVVYRVLCHMSKFGGLVGKGGGIVTKIRQETGAKIRIEDLVPGCEERIVVITGFDKDGQAGGGAGSNVGDGVKSSADGGDDGGTGGEGVDEKKEASLGTGKAMTSAQKALLLVVERIAEVEPSSDSGDGSSKDSPGVIVRMLIQTSQVGCLLGKAGSVIKQMSAESGAQIRILPKDKIPLCASAVDELVQVTGHLDEVKKALQSVSQRLLENPPREIDTSSVNKPSGPSNFSFAPFPPPGEVLPPINFHHGFPRPPFPPRLNENPDFLGPPIPNFPEGVPPGRLPMSPEPVTFRMVCINEKVGNVIGKAGSIIKKLQHDTGCDIRVADAPPDMEDRVVIVTGPALPDDRISPPQDAVLRLLEKIATPASDSKDKAILTRILVSVNQTGCLLGKGGNIITEMRRTTGAHIRILGKDQMPKCATENDESVLISGESETVREALFQITTRLKHHYFRDRIPALNHPGHPPFIDQVPPLPPFMGRRESSPPASFSNFGSSFRKFGPAGGFHEERPFGLPPSRGEKFPSSAPWPTPGIGDGAGPMPIHDFSGPPRMGGFSGGSQQPVITNTTVDVVVPRSVVPSIYGEDGDSLKQIRQISGANISLKDAEPGATETVIIISGSPDQTHAAQSLIQAFVLSETEAS